MQNSKMQNLILELFALELQAIVIVLLAFTLVSVYNLEASPLFVSSAHEDSAYLYLYEVMDKYHCQFDIYTNRDAGGNHYHPTGWYNGRENLNFNSNWRNNPHSECSCIKISWNGQPGDDSWRWNGVMWQEPEDNWNGGIGLGYDLTGATKLTFYARTDDPGLRVIFLVGYPGDSSGEVRDTLNLYATWTKYEIDLSGRDLSDICGGFAFVFTDVLDPDPHGCTFYLDDIQYEFARPDSLRFLLSYQTDCSPNDKYWAINQAYTYDNALAMLALLARGYEEDLRRARIIGDAFRFAQENDRFFSDGRLRNAYSAGDIADHLNGEVRLPGWWDDDSLSWHEDSYQVGTYTGEMAWVIIAWLSYDQHTEGSRYLNSAEALAQWIYDYCYDSTGISGYAGGYFGPDFEPQREIWKSTEHNVDVFVAFTRLCEATRDTIWAQRAEKAWKFVEEMWDSSSCHFWAGTEDSVNINYFSPLDAQTFTLLSSLDTSAYGQGISWAEDSCRVDTSGYQGFHFSTVRDGIWWEGTAQMCCAFQVKGENTESDAFLNQLRNWQASAPNGNGMGIIATFPDSIWTGITREWGGWFYYDRLHVGATSWYLFAERNYNPYWHRPTTVGVEDNISPLPHDTQFNLQQNYPNPFNPVTTITYEISKKSHVNVTLYNIIGKKVITLVDGIHQSGVYCVNWDGKDERGRSVSAGVYFYCLSSGALSQGRKMLLLR